MLPKRSRLSTGGVKKILTARSVRSQFFRLRYDDSVKAEFSVLVSKKRVKSAVARNKIKRAVFRALSHVEHLPHILGLVEVVSSIELVSDAELLADIQKLFSLTKRGSQV
jgi:ribonuclease P protein component